MSNFRKDFPLLTQPPYQPLAYLDNAATSQKPQVVIDAISDYYSQHNANIHRGIYRLSEDASLSYEQARQKIAQFIHAPDANCIIFTRGTTEAINLIAQTWGRANLKAGDEIIVSIVNHHANIVPWQMLAGSLGVKIKWLDCDDQGNLNLQQYAELLASGKVKLVALTHVSNTLGKIYDLAPLIIQAQRAGAVTVVDGAQSAPHLPINVAELKCDFFVFSGHKMCGPTGIGVLYGKKELLEAMPPYQGGGDMIMSVTTDGFTTNGTPGKFEAGTQHIAGVIGLAAAIDYLQTVGFANIAKIEAELTDYLLSALADIPSVQIACPLDSDQRIGVISFTLKNIHPHDVASHLDKFGVAVRAGNHCTQPLHTRLNLTASVRASIYFYNTKEDIDLLITAIKDCIKIY